MTRNLLEGDLPDRAVIDIGSNTVRLVVYCGSQRAPQIWLNEKVTAKLGRELASTGRMPEKALAIAMKGLRRFATILADIGVDNVQTVATAAVRDAENGKQFLEQVRALGLSPRLLSGEEEARISANGVIGAFPNAEGLVADLGGGSLELVSIADSKCGKAISLPLGILRLPALREKGDKDFRGRVAKMLGKTSWASKQKGPLYLVGGTWRAMAAFAMDRKDYPLTDPHALFLNADEADKFAKKIAVMSPDELSQIRGISSSRASGLPEAAALLRVMLEELKPDGLLFSSWGLREGLLHVQLPAGARAQDPLLAAISSFCTPRGASASIAAMIAGWTSTAAQGNSGGAERLRMAATMMALAAHRVEPNMRLSHSTDWALSKRWVALDHSGRAILATALRASCGKSEIPKDFEQLASPEALHQAVGWGLAIRLCRRIGAGTRVSLLTSSLSREGNTLVLWLDESRAELASDSVESDLKNLANWLGLDHKLQISSEGAP